MLRSAASVVFAALALAACDQAERGQGQTSTMETAWRAPPRVDRIVVGGGRITLTGRAQPGGRVVMRDGDGRAHAATAGADGAFEMAIPASTRPILLRPEDQDGQRAMPSPDAVLVLPDGAGVALSPGAPSRRLDGGSGLAAIDFDGRMALISGRKDRGAAQVRLGDGAGMDVRTDAAGSWVLRTDAANLGGSIVVDGVAHEPVVTAAAPGSVSSAGSGTLIGWSAPDGATLSTWLPAR
ncbi:MAG TPA: hypothetical protein VGR32_10735 [Brevundimonas sp.]|jgi:hypothetical protein|uniref:hypothetical protein n=1 Tax=Brevundimonas sp. TaxID=1871086 RepID=UPI002DEEDFC8|nr:hypothetical protein [Brevundimonas sp.]